MPAEVIAFDDVVKAGQSYLRPALVARGRELPVVPRVPKPRPVEFVRLERVGGTRGDVVTDRPMLDVHCWAATDADAMTLAILVRALLLAMRGRNGGVTVYDVGEVGGPQPHTDASTGAPYVAFTVWLDMRGRTI